MRSYKLKDRILKNGGKVKMKSECYVREDNSIILVGNSKLEIGIDKTNGKILSLRNLTTDTEYIQIKNFSTNFRIICPLPIPNVRDHEICGEQQIAESIEKENKEDGSVIIKVSYGKLNSKYGVFKIKVVYTIQVKPQSDETIWKIEIDNQDKYTIREVWFPKIGGIYKIGEDLVILPNQAGDIIRDPIHKFPPLGEIKKFPASAPFGPNLCKLKYRIHYPAQASMQWLDYGTEKEGLYLASYDKSVAFTGIQFEKMITADPVEGSQALGAFFVKYPFIKPGEKWESPEFVLALHQGDWHVGADKYRSWAYSWMQKCKIPDWVREANGFVLHTLKQQDGRVFDDYKDLPRILKEAKKFGVDLLYTLGWWKGGMDGDFPHYDAWDDNSLQQNIAKVHKEKGRIILYENCRIMNIRLKEYEEYGKNWAVKDMHNVEVREHWEWSTQYPYSFRGYGEPSMYGETFVIPCPSIKDWHQMLRKYAMKIAETYNADGIEMDQIGLASSLLCFDPEHPHKTPASAFGPGILEMIKTIKESTRRINPEFAILCEGIVDVYAQYTDLHYQLRGARFPAENFPELFRYTFPEVLLFLGSGVEEYDWLRRAFVLGMPFDVHYGSTHSAPYRDLNKYPNYIKHLRKLTQFRQSVKNYMIYGRFIDNVGIKSLDPNVEVKGFKDKNNNGLALVMWNKSSEDLEPTISVDIKRLGFKASDQFRVRNVQEKKPINTLAGSEKWGSKELKNIFPGRISKGGIVIILIEKT